MLHYQWWFKVRTYYIFNVNSYFTYMYKERPFKMYKIFEEIYYSRDYDAVRTYRVFEGIANPFNKIMLGEYINYEYKHKYGYIREDNIHRLNGRENTSLKVNNYNIKIETDSNYTDFFKYLNNYNNSLFVCDFDNKDYFWLSKIKPLQKELSIVQ